MPSWSLLAVLPLLVFGLLALRAPRAHDAPSSAERTPDGGALNADYTGSPRSNGLTCTTCHAGSAQGGFLSGPATYNPGGGAVGLGVGGGLKGFQLTVLTGSNGPAGSLSGANTINGVQYAAHGVGTVGPWEVAWTPPTADVGPVTVYASARRTSDGATLVDAITIAPNQAPTAAFTATPATGAAPLAVAFDAGASTDPDGTLAAYAWSFGDGGEGTGRTASHTFAEPGRYTVTLTVEDDGGLTATATTVVEATESNQAPTASFTADPAAGDAPLAVTFDASASADPDGTIDLYAWDFGDGGGASGATTSHTFAEPGVYTVRLTVRDNHGATAIAETMVEVTAPNQMPTARFTSTPAEGEPPLTVVFDGNGSSDPDGALIDYRWSFGDGGDASGRTASHTYTTPGTYTVTLTVQDDRGAAATATGTVRVGAANQAPTAAFTATPATGAAPLAVAFDAGASTDPDGTLAAYAWSFGDGGEGTGRTASHTFAEPGRYTVTLTVEDDGGLTATATTVVEVTAATDTAREDDEVPAYFAVESVYPNPFTDAGQLVVQTQAAGTYDVRVFDVFGQRVAARPFAAPGPGRVEVPLRLDAVASGVYLVTVTRRDTGETATARVVHVQ